MFSTCLFCNLSLGTNEEIAPFPVGTRLAFDPEKGRLWVVCTHCDRWNLSPLEERWEAIEECERRYDAARFKSATDNIGLVRLAGGIDLIRIGRAKRPEIAAWRYGDEIARRSQALVRRLSGRLVRDGMRLVSRAAGALEHDQPTSRLANEPLVRLFLHRRRNQVLDVATAVDGRPAIIRYGHLVDAELVRPDRNEPWSLRVRHDRGTTSVSGDAGLHTASKMLAAINAFGGTGTELREAIARVEDAQVAEGYFARVAAIAIRTSWGRNPDAPALPREDAPSSMAERLALHITKRSFWGRGAVGSEPRTLLLQLPVADRLALEMAANEDAEQRAMRGELEELEAAWRDAEEIAAIADAMWTDEEFERFKRERATRDS